MALAHSPKIVTDGLVLSIDPANIKSFQGIPLTNLSNAVSSSFVDNDSTYFKIINNTSTQIIPGGVGERVVKSVTYYNDYNGGSNICCPNYFEFGNPGTWINVTPNTTYTYAIIVKSSSNYFHPNFLYHYQYDTDGNYVTEGGYYDPSRKISLGDEWYMIWGTLTTLSNTTRLYIRLFSYEYATWNTISVAASALYLGADVVSPKHFPYHGETKPGTVTSPITSTWTGTLTNGASYEETNLGAFTFDGINDFIGSNAALSTSFASFTVIIWFYPTSVTSHENPIDCNYNYYGASGNVGPRLEMNSNGNLAWMYSNITGDNNQFYFHEVVSSGLTANTWHCAAITFNGSTNTSTTYYNGNTTGLSRTTYGSPVGFIGLMNNINLGRGFHLGGAERIYTGRIGNTQIYNRDLTPEEIKQNFNALKGRYGI